MRTTIKPSYVFIAFLVLLTVVLTGCLIQPTDPGKIDQYNNQILSMVQPFIIPITGLLGVVVYWVKATIDKKELKESTIKVALDLADEAKKVADELVAKAEKAAEKIAIETKEVAAELAKKTEEVKEVVLTKIQEAHTESSAALEKANNTNEKILKLQEAQSALRETVTDKLG